MNSTAANWIAPFREPEPEPTRPPPSNTEAEQALLGAIFRSNLAHGRVADFLLPEHFSFAIHARIYEAIGKLIDRGQQANPVTLKNLFENDVALAEVGGARYLTQLAESAVTIINAEDYGRRIHDLHLRRQLIGLGEDIANEAYEQEIDDPAIAQIERAEERLYSLATVGDSDGDLRPFSVAWGEMTAEAERAYQRGAAGLPTGLTDLDRLTGGLYPGELVVLAGRPSMGKTALATNMAYRAAKARLDDADRGAIVGFFSLEMTQTQVAARVAGEIAGVSSDRVRRGSLSAVDFERLVGAGSQLACRLPLYLDQTPGISVSQVRARARRLRRRHGLGLIVIDYLQLMASGRRENRVQEVSEISRGLKAVAKELAVPVLALSQLSRQVEQRDDKRPHLADLRESGSIEQDADVVLFLYRDSYYAERDEPKRREGERAEHFSDRKLEWASRLADGRNAADVIVAKNRSGPIGEARLFYDASLTRVSDFTREPA